jgi:alcohol dehydrogenase/propanol-preferring alcohol dehydrogenase
LAAGASDAVDANTESLTGAIAAAAQGGIAVAIDFVNNSTTARAAFEGLRRGGKLIQVGFFGGELNLPLPLMPLRALTIMGSYVGSPADLRELVELGAGGGLPPIPLTTVPQSRVNDVLCELRDGRITGRVVLNAPVAAAQTASATPARA